MFKAETAIYLMVEICLNPDKRTLGSQAYFEEPSDVMVGGSSGTVIVGSRSTESNEAKIRESPSVRGIEGLETARNLLKEIRLVKQPTRYAFFTNLLLLATQIKSNIEAALLAFAGLVRDQRDSIACLFGGALCYQALKQSIKSRNQLKRLAKVPWTVDDAEFLEKAWLLLSDIYVESDNTDLSKELLERCLKYNKNVSVTLISCNNVLTMASLIDEADFDACETFKNVPGQWPNAGNHKYYGRGHRTRYVPLGLPDAPIKLRKRGPTNTVI
ncbi:unnamed protein product [Protopolystoma xenopodis]|uniref:Tetratricopeptide repeat protein 21A/21B C-terminal ARM domain-containing protein n=1 Tax=Protopolystoma xenopodis TaxID=117903 RepID=A0A3S5CSP9_9PLAT|nr:unnamed protein product [Protopolystoma xenopodis]